MADKKEEPKKDLFVEVMFILLVFGIIILLWSYILASLFAGYGSAADIWHSIVAWFFKYIWPIIIVFGVILGLLAVVGIAYNFRKLKALAAEEREIYGPPPGKEDEAAMPIVNKNAKWERVLTHINSANASDWRLAIIEADIMLDELLRAQGYHGDSLGEMLKAVERSDMLTLDNAWEAHKIRNEIAHAGSDYLLNERDAKRAVGLFESVFKEFKII